MEAFKPRLIYDARSLNAHCTHVAYTMDTVGAVAGMAWEGIFQGSLDDKSGFHHLLLHPDSWPLFVDYVWTVLPLGWNESPFIYHTVSGVRTELYKGERGTFGDIHRRRMAVQPPRNEVRFRAEATVGGGGSVDGGSCPVFSGGVLPERVQM